MSRQILRAPWHDYCSRCIYMVTISKAPGVKDFGTLEGSVRIPRGQTGAPFISTSYVGAAIKTAIRNFPTIESNARILQYIIMPDHLHLLIFIEEPTADPLGAIIARFKAVVNNSLGMTHIFDKSFNDQILKPGRDLNTLYEYIRDNPRRLAERRTNPEYFRRINDITINGQPCQAYGNMQLLNNPFKEQVVVHRRDTAVEREEHRRLWLYTAANGGVLVSPFISPAEKGIRKEADSEDFNSRFIHIIADHFGDRYKPSGRDFDLCAAGRMLIISAAPAFGITAPRKEPLTRQQCLALNAIAHSLADASPYAR